MNIDALLGKDFYHTFFTEGIISGKSNEPVALSCNSRWVLSSICFLAVVGSPILLKTEDSPWLKTLVNDSKVDTNGSRGFNFNVDEFLQILVSLEI